MKNKIAKIVVICMIIGAYKFAYAPEELHKAKNGGAHEEISKSKNGGAQILWVEGQRGWAESGDSIWTALPYQVIFTLNGDNWGFRPPFGWSEEINFRPGSWVSPNANLQIGGGSSRAGIITMGGAFWADYYLISTDPTPPPYDQGYVYGMYPTASGIRWYNGSTWQTITPGGAAEWTDAGEYLYPADDASAWTQVYESATPSSGYRVAGAYNANIYALLGTNVSGVQGNSNNASGAGVMGIGTGTDGVYGQSDNGSYFGVYGRNTNASGTGILGVGNNVTGSYLNNGSGVAGTGATAGVYGKGVNERSTGVIGADDGDIWVPAEGAGVAGTGDTIGVIGYNSIASANINGILGGIYSGVQGRTNNTSGAGVYGVHDAASASAVGVYGTLSNSGTYDYTAVYGYDPNYSDFYGYGGQFYGGWFGVYAYTGYDGAYGVYGYEPAGGSGYAVYASGDMGASGAKPAVVRTSKGPTELYAMESPEVWFEDFGSGQLINGRAHIELDPLFLETVTIDDENPMKVFITLTDECNGVYVKKGETGFDVIELNGGKSNATFDYRVIAKRKGYEKRRMRVNEAAYADPQLYPDINEIPAKYREKRLTQMEQERHMKEMWSHAQKVRAKKVHVVSTTKLPVSQPVKKVKNLKKQK